MLLENFKDYFYNNYGIDKSSVKYSIEDSVYRAMPMGEFEGIILNGEWSMSQNDVHQDEYAGVDYSKYPYYKSLFRTHQDNIAQFSQRYPIIVEFDKAAIQNLRSVLLRPFNYFNSGSKNSKEFQDWIFSEDDDYLDENEKEFKEAIKNQGDIKTTRPRGENEFEERLYSKTESVKVGNIKNLIKRVWIKKDVKLNQTVIKVLKENDIKIRVRPKFVLAHSDLYSHYSRSKSNPNYDSKTTFRNILNLYNRGFKDFFNKVNLKEILEDAANMVDKDDNGRYILISSDIYWTKEKLRKMIIDNIAEVVDAYTYSTLGSKGSFIDTDDIAYFVDKHQNIIDKHIEIVSL